jgi:hypothetical protein
VSVVGYAQAGSYRALGRDAVDAAGPELASRMPWLAAARRSPGEIRAQRTARGDRRSLIALLCRNFQGGKKRR